MKHGKSPIAESELMRPSHAAVLFLVLIASRVTAQLSRADSGLDRLRERYADAYNRGDVAAIALMYADSAVRMPYDTPAQQGKAAIVEATRQSFAARGFTPVLRLVAADVIMRGDLAVERGAYHELQQFSNGKSAEEDGKYVFVAVHDRAGWRYLWSTFNRDRPPSRP